MKWAYRSKKVPHHTPSQKKTSVILENVVKQLLRLWDSNKKKHTKKRERDMIKWIKYKADVISFFRSCHFYYYLIY